MGLSPLTRIVTNLERHLLSLSNRDFAAHSHPALTDGFHDDVGTEAIVQAQSHGRESDSTRSVAGKEGGKVSKKSSLSRETVSRQIGFIGGLGCDIFTIKKHTYIYNSTYETDHDFR